MTSVSYYYNFYASPLGRLTLMADDNALVGLWTDGQRYYGADILHMAQFGNNSVLDMAYGWLDRYFSGHRPNVSELPLNPIGGDFRRAVWNALCDIPYGRTTTYGEIAHRVVRAMGRDSMSARAVGGAIGHNPISIIIPCHRVVGRGGLTGYAGGIGIKRALLNLESIT